jgi:hypothetical protein
MFWNRLKPAALLVGAFILLSSDIGVVAHHSGDAPDGKKERPPVRIEFKGWFSNPTFSGDGRTS